MSDGLRVSITLEFPTLDRGVLADHLAPVLREVIAAGGTFTSLYITPDTDDDEEDTDG